MLKNQSLLLFIATKEAKGARHTSLTPGRTGWSGLALRNDPCRDRSKTASLVTCFGQVLVHYSALPAPARLGFGQMAEGLQGSQARPDSTFLRDYLTSPGVDELVSWCGEDCLSEASSAAAKEVSSDTSWHEEACRVENVGFGLVHGRA